MKQYLMLLFLSIAITQNVKSQDFIPLWEDGKMPNSKGLKIKDSIDNERLMEVAKPGIHVFLTSKQENKKVAVLIIPGGGYHHLAYQISGFTIAKWFNTLGINAFVLSHRLPISPNVTQSEIVPLQDAERAMRIIRANAVKWEIDSNKVGVMGSSAGGHLAASLATIQDDFAKVNDSYDTFSFQPNFSILVSPVIDMGSFAHKGSRENLLGKQPSAEMLNKYSLQNQVSKYTPPTFLVHAYNDKSVLPNNSLLFYSALVAKNIPSTLHIFQQGGHAIAINNNPGSTSQWIDLCESWLKEIGIIN